MKTLADPGVRITTLHRIAGLRPTSERAWGRMTAHQTICHLTDSFMVPLGLRTASPATGTLQRTIVKWAALYLPAPWPKGIPTRPEIDQAIAGTAPAEFERDRRKLTEIVGQFCSSGDLALQSHPIFGRMTAGQWLRWGYLHADHHLRQFRV